MSITKYYAYLQILRNSFLNSSNNEFLRILFILNFFLRYCLACFFLKNKLRKDIKFTTK